MSEKKVKKCPKCDGIMMRGILSIKERMRLETDLGRRWLRLFIGGWALEKGTLRSDMIVPYHCESCGYIELYKKLKKRRNKP
jgi:hypothetical protein